MPRVYLNHDALAELSDDGPEPNYPADFCEECWPPDTETCMEIAGVSFEDAEACIADAVPVGHDHPPYEEEDYRCEDCENDLTEDDD